MPVKLSPQSLQELCERLSLPLHPAQAEKLALYLELLLKWNSKINLTASHDWREVTRDLVADSFHLAGFIAALPLPKNTNESPRTWDLGAGGGLPGIPLRILWQAGTCHLIELREKRALFLQTALALLKLPATFARRGDAAAFMQTEAAAGKPADLILSRAFMPWQELLAYVQPYLAPRGILLLMLRGDSFCEAVPGWELVGQCSYPSPAGPRQFVALSVEV